MLDDSKIIVKHEDFKDFSIGPFPYDPEHSAMGEYHCYLPAGYRGNWYDPITCSKWRMQGPTWIVTEDNGKKYMEQTRVQVPMDDLWPMLITGDYHWRDYTLEATVRMLSTYSHTGILFRYTHSRRHYALCFEGQRLILLKRDQEEFHELAAVDYAYDCDTYYRLKVECYGPNIKCYVDDQECLSVQDNSYDSGKVGITSRMPAQFTDITISMPRDTYEELVERKRNYFSSLNAMRSKYPQPMLWKVIDLKNFGAGRQIRFGHLTGTDEMFIVIAQNQKRVSGDAYAHISCLTAIDLDGNILWQIGEPDPANAYLTADLPFQVCDVDMDGKDEVIVARNFQLMILDGSTGKIKRSIPTPYSEEPDSTLNSIPLGKYAFDRVNVDAIRIANFTGKAKPTDILIKDRYSRVWAYDNQLNFLWKFQHGNTGHFPYTVDIDGDGKEEMIVCYNLVDHDGKLIWTLPVKTDHTDEIIVGKFHPSHKEDIIAMVSGDEGFMLIDLKGNILKKNIIGHGQRISAGNYRPDRAGLEICVTTYWGHQGIIYIYDGMGELLHQFESPVNGNIIAPVNWTGDGSDLILLNGHVEHGGMIDGYGNKVVQFPNDGHPELCAEVIDLVGDARDEIVLWDERRMYIYTQDNKLDESNVYNPLKYPHYNGSNYRGEYSYPRK